MKLADLLDDVPVVEVRGGLDQPIDALTFDSRTAGPGSLFVALKGSNVDGHRFISAVIAAGARAVVCETLPQNLAERVAYVVVPNCNAALGALAANFFGHPSDEIAIVGVTGTNGKTTTATSLYRLFTLLGNKCGLLSTIENRVGTEPVPATYTTPDAVQLQSLLRRMVDEGCSYCFMEVSSHAVHQRRIGGVNFAGAIFSNLTHDHLDYHKTIDAYFAAKKQFFDDLPATAFALANIDDARGLQILRDTAARKHTYSLKSEADFLGRVLQADLNGTKLIVNGVEVTSKLRGKFNAYNLLAVYVGGVLLGRKPADVADACSSLEPVRGRYEVVRSVDGVLGVVDFAHTPDALENILVSLRDVAPPGSQIITVIGCGGDRDKEKRPAMAAIASQLSDQCIFTSDNPRSEDPDDILAQMKAGVADSHNARVRILTDRREAITAACAAARPRDVILVAGKGHETYQEIFGQKYPFDDLQVLEVHLSERRPLTNQEKGNG